MPTSSPEPTVDPAAELRAGEACCRSCGYPLRDLAARRCPECARPFDPDDRRTWGPAPVPPWRRVAAWATGGAVLVLAAYASGRLGPGAVHVVQCNAAPCRERVALLIEAPIVLAALVGVGALLRTRLGRPLPPRVRGWARNLVIVGGLVTVGAFAVTMVA